MANRRAIIPLLLWLGLILVVLWAWTRYGTDKLTTVLTVVSTLVAMLPVLNVGPLRLSTPSRPSTPQQVDEAAEKLAIEVRKQWDEEARRRRLQEARQMLVRWRVDDGAVSPGVRRLEMQAGGDMFRLVDEFAARPFPLVVIGEPGSGKTGLCVILTLSLLKEASRHRVPVLLQVSSWDPDENLDTWVARQLVEDYPFLGNEARFGTTVAAEIVAQRRVLPVLDGLDEMSAELRPVALKAIEDDWSSNQPFVLTCRTDEFRAATAASVLVGVQVVRLLPIEPHAAASYLLDTASAVARQEWEPVLAAMVADPEGSLAKALTMPLMLFLAAAAYDSATAAASPTELLDQRRFARKADVEQHLLDRFIPTVYRTRPPRAFHSPTRPSRRWAPPDAERTLTFLARHLHRLGTRDLAWWQLQRAVPQTVFHVLRTVVGALACGVLGWILFGLFGRPILGVGLGAVIGVASALPLGVVQEKKPRRFVPRVLRKHELAPEYLVRDVGFAVIGALAGGLIVGLLYDIHYGVAIGLVFGFVFGMVRRFTEPTESKEPVSPVSVLNSDRATVLYAVGLGSVAGTLVGGFMGGVVGAADGFILTVSPVQEGILGAATGLLLGGAGLGMIVHSTSALGKFTTARLWLRHRHRTPLLLMTFLQDAHKLGVLRQLGPYYQFRHALLQERLLQRSDPTLADAAGITRTAPERNQ